MSTTTEATTAALLASVRSVLLDFDGPICSIFAGLPAPQVAAGLADILAAHDEPVPAEASAHGDPLDVLRYAGTVDAELADLADHALRTAELRAVETAQPTEGAADSLAAYRTPAARSPLSATTPRRRCFGTSNGSGSRRW